MCVCSALLNSAYCLAEFWFLHLSIYFRFYKYVFGTFSKVVANHDINLADCLLAASLDPCVFLTANLLIACRKELYHD